MDALQLLSTKINVMKLIEHYDFDRMKAEGEKQRGCCKLHGGNNPTSFVIDVETGLWYCHTQCGGGDIYTLVQKMENIAFPQAVQWVANFFDIDIASLEIQERTDSHIKEMKEWIKALKSRKKKEVQPYVVDAEVKQVSKFRSFKEETLSYFGLGWVEKIKLEKREGGFYELRNRLLFPIWRNGVQIGASYRRVAPNDIPKWSHQPLSIETKNILYNYDMAHGAQEIVVVEGIPDVWAFHEIGVTAVATFGANVTEEQYKLLMRLGCDITMAYDGDVKGQQGVEKAVKLFKNKATIRRVEFDVQEDPESIDREELRRKFESRKRI